MTSKLEGSYRGLLYPFTGLTDWLHQISPPCTDEIWIKLGGDKGGKSMKVNFQILRILETSIDIEWLVEWLVQ